MIESRLAFKPCWKALTGQQPGQRRKRARHRGQNLVELVLTLPFVVIMLFFIIELGRAWMVYEGANALFDHTLPFIPLIGGGPLVPGAGH